MTLFKDMYKKANDSILADSARLRVMARIENPPHARPYERVVKYAALAACLVFTFAAVSVYRSFEKSKGAEDLVPVPLLETGIDAQVSENDTQETVVLTPEPEKAEIDMPVKAEKPVQKAAPQNSKAVVAEALPKQADEVNTDAVEAIENVATEIARKEIETEIVVNDIVPASGGGSAAAALYTRDAQPVQQLTLSEYYSFLGKNVKEKVRLPEGFECITQDAVFLKTDENGNYTSDEWSIVYQNEEKVVDIETTKNTETVQKYIDREDYSKSTVCGIDAVVIKDDENYRAYMVSDEIGYTVTTYGVDESVVEDLLVSLAE